MSLFGIQEEQLYIQIYSLLLLIVIFKYLIA